MRTLKKIIIGFIIFIAFAYALPATLVRISYFQEKLSQQIASYLKKKLQTEVYIRQIDFGFFNQLILRDVYLEDLSGEVIFKAKRLAAGFEFLPLLQKKWRFNSVQLFTFHLNLSKAAIDSQLNIQFIIDAFAKPDSTAINPAIDLRIKKLNLQLGNFSYRVKNEVETTGKFNPRQLLISEISSKIHIYNLNNKELSLQFNKLNFKEQSGLQLKNVTFDLIANEKTAKINQLIIELGESSFLFTELYANYNLLDSGKNEGETANFQFNLKTSAIYPKDLSAFVPVFSDSDDRISLEGDFTGIGNNLTIKNLYFRYYNQIMINANADLRNIFHPNRNLFYIRGSISDSFFSAEGIERIVNNYSGQTINLPKQVKQMKNIRFEGDINGSFDDLAAWGVLNTDVGIVRTSFTLGKNETRFLKGQIASENLNLEKLLNNTDYSEMAFDIRLDTKQDPDHKYSGSFDASFAKLAYKGYAYNNLNLSGAFSPTSFEGNLNLNSPEGKISGNGTCVFNGKDSKFDLTAKVSDLQLDKLNLTNKYKQSKLSFKLDAHLTGNNPDNLKGFLSAYNVQYESDKRCYFLNNFKITSTPSEQEKHIKIDSEILSGEIWGNYSFMTIVPDLKQLFARYLPALIKPDLNHSGNDKTDVTMHLSLEDLTDISNVFELPFSFQGRTEISGQYKGNELNLEFTTPRAVISGSQTDSLRMVFTNSDSIAQVDISGISLQKKNARVKFNAQIDAAMDQINTALHWGNGFSNYWGDINLTTLFLKKENQSPIRIETNINQTDLIFNDSVWTLKPANIIVDSTNIRIDNFYASHKDQFLKINGAISRNPEEELLIELNRIDLEYVFQSLSIPALEFGGIATGFVKAQDAFLTKKLETNLEVTDLTFNAVHFGHLDLTGTWDDEDQGVILSGKVIKNDSTFVDVNGIIYPVDEEISIDFDASNADARFLRKYLDKVVQDLTGNLSGHIRLFGYWNDPTVEGDFLARDCRFGIRFLNTFYTFSDSVKCLPDTIKINNTFIYDEKGNKAIANGFVKHRYFNDFIFSTTVNYSNFMIFNAPKSLNPMFYGTAFGSGTASLYGTEDVINIDVTAQNTDNTKMTLNFMEETDVEDYDFIRFVSAKNPISETSKKQVEISNPVWPGLNTGPEIRFNLMLNATPQATIDMIMDPVSGDKISGYGNGNLQIQYGTKTPLKVLGNYMIEQGKYNFSFQQLFIRNFDIQEASLISFRGNPYTAELDIKANYTVNANLDDLDRQLIETKRSARNNVPVNCVLLLTGPLDRPTIGFDLNLPGATDELARQVKSYIRTDDMMNRQIGYLLVFSRFYTPAENMRDNASAINNNWSYLTSTLSTQISNMLGLLSDNFQVGTTFHQSNAGAQTGAEFDLLLSGQLLNNRLIVNGNFGYINNPYIDRNQNNIPLIGDFDLEYKLTKSGDIRLKGFNHYNFRNYYSITPEMTQGFGILFRKDFSHWLDLFGKKNSGKN